MLTVLLHCPASRVLKKEILKTTKVHIQKQDSYLTVVGESKNNLSTL